MGFFGDMKTINKIYSLLKVLEEDVADYVGNVSPSFVKGNPSYFENKERDIRNLLGEISSIAEHASNTVQCADFQFLGQKCRLGNLICTITQIVEETSRQVRVLQYSNK